MTQEDRTEIEETLKELRARNTALETIVMQLMVRISTLFEHPQEFVRFVMMHAEDSLQRGRDQATGKDKAIAEDALDVFRSHSMNLIAALTPRDSPQ